LCCVTPLPVGEGSAGGPPPAHALPSTGPPSRDRLVTCPGPPATPLHLPSPPPLRAPVERGTGGEARGDKRPATEAGCLKMRTLGIFAMRPLSLWERGRGEGARPRTSFRPPALRHATGWSLAPERQPPPFI